MRLGFPATGKVCLTTVWNSAMMGSKIVVVTGALQGAAATTAPPTPVGGPWPSRNRNGATA